jgi:hypothetical protein
MPKIRTALRHLCYASAALGLIAGASPAWAATPSAPTAAAARPASTVRTVATAQTAAAAPAANGAPAAAAVPTDNPAHQTYTDPQPPSNADFSGHGANTHGPYDSTRSGAPALNGNGGG